MHNILNMKDILKLLEIVTSFSDIQTGTDPSRNVADILNYFFNFFLIFYIKTLSYFT